MVCILIIDKVTSVIVNWCQCHAFNTVLLKGNVICVLAKIYIRNTLWLKSCMFLNPQLFTLLKVIDVIDRIFHMGAYFSDMSLSFLILNMNGNNVLVNKTTQQLTQSGTSSLTN